MPSPATKRRLLGGAAVMAAAGLALGPSGFALASTTWVPTATKALAPSLVKATDLGATPTTTQIRIAVGLKLRNTAALSTFLHDVNTPGTAVYGKFLTPSAFLAGYGPTSAQVQAVSSYLTSEGFTGVQATTNNIYVTAQGTAAQAEAAFNTHLENYSQFGKTVYANTMAAQVPSTLGGTVAAVLGLNDIVAIHPMTAKAAAPSGACPPTSYPLCPGYTPQEFWKAYDVGSNPTGSKTATAIMAEGNLTQVVKDLRTYESAFRLPQVPYTIVPVGLASPDTSGADEWDLDTQTSTGMAGNVSHLYIYDTTSLTDEDVGLEFSKWASQNVTRGASASFGECEFFPYVDGLMVTNDEVMNEAAAQGQTMHASTGDTGSACPVLPTNGVPLSGPLDVSYPAASPYIVGVGGTTLLTNADGSYNNELAWDAGGGGFSDFEYSPYWQSGVVPTNAGNAAGVGRGLPDIAMDADPQTGAIIYVAGQQTVIGGTSLSSPLALGVWARLESTHGNTLGFASPRLYALYPKSATPPTSQLTYPPYPLHDIIVGNNGAYDATPGWDYTTGLGSYSVGRVNRAL